MDPSILAADPVPPDEGWEDWLRQLHRELWARESAPDRFGRSMRFESRRLTSGEWATVQDLIRRHGLICSMHNACMGFGCGMVIYRARPALYPGTESASKPEALVDITQNHLPVDPGEPEPRFSAAWPILSAFTHNDANAGLLKRHGLEAPQPMGYYEY